MVQDICGKAKTGPGPWRTCKVLKGGHSKRRLLQVQSHRRDNTQGGEKAGWCQRTGFKNSFYFFTCFHWAFKGPHERKCVLSYGNKTLEPLRPPLGRVPLISLPLLTA